MSKYTAEDFARARVAIRGERESARRTYPGDDLPWLSRNGGRWSDHKLAELGWVPVQESQPLTAADVTDEMVARARISWHDYTGTGDAMFRHLLTAALTEPPARPEGAEEIQRLMHEFWLTGPTTISADSGRELADYLAENGVRVVGGQS